jgi:hypothetical protein
MAQQFCRVMQQENEAREQRQQEAAREMTERPGTRGRTVVHTQEQVRAARGAAVRGAHAGGQAMGSGSREGIHHVVHTQEQMCAACGAPWGPGFGVRHMASSFPSYIHRSREGFAICHSLACFPCSSSLAAPGR